MVAIGLVAPGMYGNQYASEAETITETAHLKGFVRFLTIGILETMADWRSYSNQYQVSRSAIPEE